ncbi:unnamed protein product [Prunus armeniaca]
MGNSARIQSSLQQMISSFLGSKLPKAQQIQLVQPSHRLRTKWPKPSHTHPCGSEILVVLEGTLYVGFITSNADNNRLISKLLNKGDVFVFPIGLIHFQLNVGYGNAVAFAGLSSQNPGVITIANAVFGSKPPIDLDVLAKAFQVDNKLVDYLQKQF